MYVKCRSGKLQGSRKGQHVWHVMYSLQYGKHVQGRTCHDDTEARGEVVEVVRPASSAAARPARRRRGSVVMARLRGCRAAASWRKTTSAAKAHGWDRATTIRSVWKKFWTILDFCWIFFSCFLVKTWKKSFFNYSFIFYLYFISKNDFGIPLILIVQVKFCRAQILDLEGNPGPQPESSYLTLLHNAH